MNTEDVSIVRAPRTKDRPYFSMCRATAQDERLSWEARGVLAYLLSKPDDWQVQIPDLQQKCGRDKVRGILQELIDGRYLVKSQEHDPETGKFLRNHYQTYETPFTENPSTVEPSTVNPPITYKRKKQNTDTHSPKPPKGAGKTAKPSAEELFRIEYEQYFTLAEALRAPFLKMDVPAKNTPRSALVDYLEAAKQLAPCGATPDEIPALYAYVKERARREEWKTFGVKALVKYYPDFKAQAYQVSSVNAGDWQLTPAPALPDVNLSLEDRQRMVESTRKQRIGGV